MGEKRHQNSFKKDLEHLHLLADNDSVRKMIELIYGRQRLAEILEITYDDVVRLEMESIECERKLIELGQRLDVEQG